MWDEERNHHLFMASAIESAHRPLELVVDYGMVQALPKGMPMLQSSSSRNWTCPDNVFCMESILADLLKCNTSPEDCGPNTDHLPILTLIDTTLAPSLTPPLCNFREVDWKKFNKSLKAKLAKIGPPMAIISEPEFQRTARGIEEALHRTMEKEVLRTHPHPHRKRWWMKELTTMCNELKMLSKASYTFHARCDHPSHSHCRTKAREYNKAIQSAKKNHWKDWLEEANSNDLWIANRYLSNPYGDSSKACVSTLKKLDNNGVVSMLNTNKDKSQAFSSVPQDYRYPMPEAQWSTITKDQLTCMIKNLSPYKAPGPDGVPNIIFQKSHVLSSYLLHLFNTVFTLKTYYNPWRESTTVILCKPRKADYTTPKAYHPIALLNTTAKLLSAIIAENTTYILKKHQLLLGTHFGGRPGHSTKDLLILLESTIRHAWRQKQVVSALFLDIEGAFPNAITD
ncbi:hypothetical protein M404DRAFT_30970 [Pisolithus tinctorius Marx 270]|uniref:Reverse transcriptase domain-containing protein n=1 Tax=Pisolithus tinctorius Marx 270 TaxID=870435 RepID=A0A0C3NCH0_PISTI|nr:hypothetical protein M404DRAFT_30970 [Pisolithus tinctorius Marx 270]